MKLLKFGAVWCGPCKAYAPTIEKVKTEMPNIEVVEYDVDSEEAQSLIEKYGIRSVPTTIIIKDNDEVIKLVGAQSYESLKEILS